MHHRTNSSRQRQHPAVLANSAVRSNSLIRRAAWILLLVLCTSASPALAGFTVVHQFAGDANDGGEPRGLIVDGDDIYGTSVRGGDSDVGTVYRIKTDGTNQQLLHEFAGADGSNPLSAPLLIGSNLYGGALQGGANNAGTLYRLNNDGTGFVTLHNFTGNPGGRGPQTEPVLSGGVLYGTTRFEGTSGGGTVYKINPDGSGFVTLRNFAGGSDGVQPKEVNVDGSTIYAASAGGANGGGTLFRLNTDGTGYQLLRSFTGGGPGGSSLSTSPILIGSELYGMGRSGGANGTGVIYRINTDGTGFTVLHDFADTTGGDWGASARLMADGSTLYGITDEAGAEDKGTLFRIETDGSGFEILHEFTGFQGNGESRAALVGSTIFGTRRHGGLNGEGTLFAFLIPEPSSYLLAALALGGFLLWARRSRRT